MQLHSVELKIWSVVIDITIDVNLVDRFEIVVDRIIIIGIVHCY